MKDMQIRTERTIKETTTVLLTDAHLYQMMLDTFGGQVPSTARFSIDVPRGGDYSGERLDIGRDVPALIVTWTEEREEVDA